MTSPTIPLEQARTRLAALWIFGFVVIILLLVAQTMGTAFGNRANEVWNWVAPLLSPTLALIITVWASTSVRTPDAAVPNQLVSRSFYRASFWLSLFYLLLILSALIFSPLVAALRPDDKFTMVDAVKLSSLWLALIQSIVVFFIGALFFKKENAPSRGAADSQGKTGIP
jgi:hypothetical protein